MSDYFTRIATAPKHVVQISTQGKTYLTIKQDGSVELGPDFSENEALRGFWDYAESLGPKKEIARLVAERDALREENARLREALQPFVKTLELNCTEADPDDFSSAKKARHVLATYAPPKPLFGREGND